jgi:hypothetical protein
MGVTRSKLHARFVSMFSSGKSGRPVSARSVRSAEARLGSVFPRSYVEFVCTHGGAFTPTILTTIVDRELDHSDLQDIYTPAQAAAASPIMWQGGMSRRLVMVAGDCMGNAFCFRKQSQLRDDAEVLFFDHEFNDLGPVATGFDRLLAWYVEHCGPAVPRPRRRKTGRARAT